MSWHWQINDVEKWIQNIIGQRKYSHFYISVILNLSSANAKSLPASPIKETKTN